MANEKNLRSGFKYFNPFMVLLWRLGLGKFINAAPQYGGRIMVLTHTGRKSGQMHRTPINYALVNDEVYCLVGFGSISDWYRNVQANPHVEVWLPDGWWQGTAGEVAREDPEFANLLRAVLIASGFAAKTFGGVDPHTITDDALLTATPNYRLVHIQRTAPQTGAGGPGDLSWVWVVSTLILVWLYWTRKK